jgi:hypothetical protein
MARENKLSLTTFILSGSRVPPTSLHINACDNSKGYVDNLLQSPNQGKTNK